MIVDKIQNAHLYTCCDDRLAKAFEILKDKSLAEKPDGKYEVDGKKSLLPHPTVSVKAAC